MKERHQIKGLNDLAAICSVQRMDIDMQIERARTRVRALESRHGEETRALAGFQDGWRQAVSGRSFDLAAASFWSAEILREEAVIDSLTAEIQAETSHLRQLGQARAAAEARGDAVETWRRTLMRRTRNRRDEALMEAYGGSPRAGWRQACE